MQIIIIKKIGHGSRLAGDTTSRLQVARSKSSKDGFFGFLSEKKRAHFLVVSRITLYKEP